MSDYPELQVLDENANYRVASVSGMENPVVIIDDKFLAELTLLCRDAKACALALRQDNDVYAILKFCDELGLIFEHYAITRNKYFGSASEPIERAAVLRELEELRKKLDKLSPR